MGTTVTKGSKKIPAGPELFFGFVGAVGTDLNRSIKLLKEELAVLKYQSQEIKLSQLLEGFAPNLGIKTPEKKACEEDRVEGLMEAGNVFRKLTGREDAMAMLAINAIDQFRVDNRPTAIDEKQARRVEDKQYALNRQAYIFSSLKHPKEVEQLRKIYGENFFLISVYSPREKRLDWLADKIRNSHNASKVTKEFRESANQLIEKDLKQEDIKHGQSVRDVFHLADFFLADSEEGALRAQVSRFTKLLFGHPFHTPTIDEYCMFMASASALRSADLSRQVGAIIANNRGEQISSGCNEVPQAKGGAFWEGTDQTTKDYRDFQEGFDANAIRKLENITEIFDLLQKNNMLCEEHKGTKPEVLAELSLYGERPYLEISAVASIIEYGRIVHAEMAAITDAARRGISVKGEILYCTTFPCHMCARHILASGIHKVIYIEPYPKSLTKELYKKSVQIDDGTQADIDAVKFEPFVGIAPRIYFKFFKMPKRKDVKGRGRRIEWDSDKAIPRLYTPNEKIYLFSEKVETKRFIEIVDKAKKENIPLTTQPTTKGKTDGKIRKKR